MARLLSALGLAALLSLTYAQNSSSSVAPTSVHVTNTPVMTPVTSAHVTNTPVMTPVVTPTPAPMLPNNTYFLNNSEAKYNESVCVHLVARIMINVSYMNSMGQWENVGIMFDSTADVGTNSSCYNETASKALLDVVSSSNEVPNPHTVQFNFTGNLNKGSQAWQIANVNLKLYLADFPGYNATSGEFLVLDDTPDKLTDESTQNVEFTRSFYCNAVQNLAYGNLTGVHKLNATLVVSELQVQAFQFKDYTTGKFGNTRVCQLDNPSKGNKIVPIAVGAALAGLVIVVLIAYLIGRLKSRRQSSYEALS